ncbi:MAG: MFS transporter [Pseudomonadota bacterium]
MIGQFAGALRGERKRDVLRRSTIVGLVSFLTLIDLFGSQALLPQLIEAYSANPALMGLAVNASTFGMAVSGLVVAWFADRIDRKRGIWISLVLLSVPTFFLGVVDSVSAFMALRVLQGVFMAAAFTLTLTYLSEQCDVTAAGGAMAAYITGNVASNLLGRILAVSTADYLGLTGSFWTFAALNLCGAMLAYVLIGSRDSVPPERTGPPLQAWRQHLSNPALRVSFFLGFAILFVFVGVFTYVNLYLTDDIGLDPALLGLVYLVFLPALITTPYASRAVTRFGPQRVFQVAAGIAMVGVAITLVQDLAPILTGLALIGVSTFFMQAAATGFVGRTATQNRAAANGLYLTSYYVGGLAGAFLLGWINTLGGWTAVAVIVLVVLVLMIPFTKALAHPGPVVVPNAQARSATSEPTSDPS